MGGSHREAGLNFTKTSLPSCLPWQEVYEKAAKPEHKAQTHTSWAGWERTAAEISEFIFMYVGTIQCFPPRRLVDLGQMARSRL